MPRPSKGARLCLDKGKWIIRDGTIFKRTGCSAHDRAGAEKALAAHISEKFKPAVREHHPARLTVAEVLTAYGREHAIHGKGASPMMAGFAIATLTTWWKSKTLAEVRGSTCRAYAASRRAEGRRDATSRRELAILQAAINHWHREHGPLESVPVVTLPPKPAPREHWLTRADAAMLLAGALGWYRRQWTDVFTRKVEWEWARHKPSINRAAARFIVIGLHTGTRHAAILSLQWMPNTFGGWIDFERGVMHRRGEGVAETKKRQPPVRLGRRLLSHMNRWKRIDAELRDRLSKEQSGKSVSAFVHIVSSQNGGVLQKMRKPWYEAREFAGLGRSVTPHILRHTRATWLVQSGINYWEAAGTLGMSVQMLEEVYGHHHPDFQRKAAEV